MKTFQKKISIDDKPEKVFQQMDDLSKTRMHISEISMKMVGITVDFSETVTKWQPPKLKEWGNNR